MATYERPYAPAWYQAYGYFADIHSVGMVYPGLTSTVGCVCKPLEAFSDSRPTVAVWFGEG